MPHNARDDRPIAVVFGDSIAEGHPALHGRLHPGGEERFDAGWPDAPGQLSHEIAVRVPRYRWVNHGIGSQTTVDLWARWRRDVLGQRSDPGDGRGARTLPARASLALVICGLNDVFRSVSDADLRQNMRRMARSARTHGVATVFLTLGPHRGADDATARRIIDAGAWMRKALPALGAEVVDWHGWAQDAQDPGVLRASMACPDGVHPTPAGYVELAEFIVRGAPSLAAG